MISKLQSITTMPMAANYDVRLKAGLISPAVAFSMAREDPLPDLFVMLKTIIITKHVAYFYLGWED